MTSSPSPDHIGSLNLSQQRPHDPYEFEGNNNRNQYYSTSPPIPAQSQDNPLAMNQFTDPNNTTVFVGGLSGYVTEDELRSFFQGFGEITYVKIPPGKGCGFVQLVHRHATEMAINQMQSYRVSNSRVGLYCGFGEQLERRYSTPSVRASPWDRARQRSSAQIAIQSSVIPSL